MRFKNCFTFRELIGILVNNNPDSYRNMSVHAIGLGGNFYDCMSDYIGSSINSYPFVETIEGNTDITQICKDIVNMCVVRFADWICVEKFEESLSGDDVDHWFDKFITILLETYDRYSTLLSFYSSEKSNLMKALKETEKIEASSSMESESRFNDTPQNSQGQTSFNDDEHSTNQGWASNEGSSGAETTRNKDLEYTMDKLDRITRLYRNMLLDWSNVFSFLLD